MQKKLFLLMEENNLTIKELASKIGISEKQMGLKLKGYLKFKSSEMFKISEILQKSIEEIFLSTMYENSVEDISK